MKLREEENERGLLQSVHVCETCGAEFIVIPPISDDQDGWENCMGDDCPSYDPHRDAELLFMSDKEIAQEKRVVSLEMLRKRRDGCV